MKVIKTYIKTIEPYLIGTIKGKPGELVALIQSNNYVSEEALIAEIGKGRKYYSNLKNKTIEALEYLLLASPPNGNTLAQKKYEICQKKFLISQKLIYSGSRVEGIKAIRKALQIAEKYSFHHFAAEICNQLVRHHAHYQYDPDARRIYGNQMEFHLSQYIAEKKAERMHYDLIGKSGKLIKNEMAIESAYHNILALDGGPRCLRIATLIRVLQGFLVCDYEMIVRACSKLEHSYTGDKNRYDFGYHGFLLYKGIALLSQGKYQNAKIAYRNASKGISNKMFFHYVLEFYKAVNALHAGDYLEAYQIHRDNRNCRFPKLKEQFAIIEAFLYFLYHQGYFVLDTRFRIGKYLNQTIIAQSEKGGDNVNIIISELLVHLARDRGKFIDRVEAVNAYSYRHLTDKSTQRAKWFLRVLCTLPRANFNPVALQRLAGKSIELIKINPISMGANFAVEIIPFEVLLEMILEKIGAKTG